MLTVEGKKGSEFPPLTENNSVGVAGEALRAKVSEGFRDTLGHSVFWAETVLRSNVQLLLYSLAELQSNWDSYGAPAPNKEALRNATRILAHLNTSDFAWIRIIPSAEGGIGFCFSKDDRYADIEASNEGDVIGVRYAGMQTPLVIETDGTDSAIEAAVKEIRDHLSA